MEKTKVVPSISLTLLPWFSIGAVITFGVAVDQIQLFYCLSDLEFYSSDPSIDQSRAWYYLSDMHTWRSDCTLVKRYLD